MLHAIQPYDKEANKVSSIQNTYAIYLFREIPKGDSVLRKQLCRAMRRMSIRNKWIVITKRVYLQTKAQIKVGKRMTEVIDVTKGLKHRYSLFPMIFSIYMKQALERW